MAKKDKNIQTNEMVVYDPETEMEISFTGQDQFILTTIEKRIVGNFIQIGVDLNTIKERKLYLLRECDSMREYIAIAFAKSLSYAQSLMKIGRDFGSNPSQFDGMTLPQILLLHNDEDTKKALKDGSMSIDNGQVIMPSGESMDLPTYTKTIEKKAAIEIKSKETKLKDQLSDAKSANNALQDTINHAAQEKSELLNKLNSYEKTIQDLMQKKDLDGMRVAFVTHRDEAATMMDESLMVILDHLGHIDNIPHDLVDAKLSGHFARTIAGIESAVERIRDRWSPIIYTPTAGSDRGQMVPE